MSLYQNYINNEQLTALKFVLFFIRAEIHQDRANKIRDFLKAKPVDWRFVLSLVDKHRVLPIFYANLKKLGLQEFCPQFVQKHLSSRYMEIIANNLRLSQKLARLLALFETHGVPALPFKGPILAHCLYGDASLRYFQDLDILVPKACVSIAGNLLEQSGFSLIENHLSGSPFQQLLKYGRECLFLDRSRKIKIDLHWQLGGPFRRSYDYAFCKQRLKKIRFNNRETYNSLSAEDTLLHLCVNGSHDIWNNLEKILCVADFIEQHPNLDWELMQKLANQLHCRRMLFLGLFLARDVFEVAMPQEIVDQIEKDKKIEKIAEKIYDQMFNGVTSNSHFEKRLGEIPYYMKVRENFLDKLLYLFRRIFVPTQKDLKHRHLDSRLSLFYFISRPIDLIVEFVMALRQSFRFL